MRLFDIAAILLTAAALGGFINQKWIKLPSSIGLLLLAMGLGFVAILSERLGWTHVDYIQNFLSNINFKDTIFHGMLSFLLFAGALQINIEDLKKAKLPIAITATVSTIFSTMLIGTAFFFLSHYLGFTQVTLLEAMLFGAILSPTDPIAVLSIVKKMSASKKIETTIAGESLFNDGVAIVMFLGILEMLNTHGTASIMNVTALLGMEVGGGIIFGLILGWVANRMLRETDTYQIALFIHLAVATGGYALADQLQFSAPLAMVIAGIMIGNQSRNGRSDEIKIYIDAFWKAIDEVLNAVLFLLIGLEMIVIHTTSTISLLGVASILIALVSRFISLAIPLACLRSRYAANLGAVIILTWGGLRGALSIAMVLSLPEYGLKALFLPCIYFVVIFSIAIQGLTFGRVLKRYKMDLQRA